MSARIYRPSRNPQQSGKGSSKWVLVYEQSARHEVEPLMGYTSTTDARQQLRLDFENLESAEAYAQKMGLAYTVQPAHDSEPKRSNYSDNFRFTRKFPWTH